VSEFTRVVVVGSMRRTTVVLPADEPIFQVIPDIADLIGEPPVPGGFTLVTNLGTEVNATASATDQALLSGTVLRLVPIAQAPQPPEVSDVTDTVAEHFAERVNGWSRTHRFTLAAVTLGVITAALTLLPDVALWVPFTTYFASLVAAQVLGWTVSARAGLLTAAVGFGAIPALAFSTLALWQGQGVAGWAIVPTALLAGWLLAGAASTRQALLGTAVGGVLALFAGTLFLLGLTVAQVAASLVPLVALALGGLPLAALSLAGVTRLDDQAIEGRTVARIAVVERVAHGYRLLGWAVYAVAVIGGLAVAALLAEESIWATLLGCALALTMMLRTRVTPHASQAWALWVASLTGLILGALLHDGWPAWVLPVTGVAVGVVAVLLTVVQPRRHTRVRMRRWGDFVETLAVLALLPLILGVFGVYGQLLQVFS